MKIFKCQFWFLNVKSVSLYVCPSQGEACRRTNREGSYHLGSLDVKVHILFPLINRSYFLTWWTCSKRSTRSSRNGFEVWNDVGIDTGRLFDRKLKPVDYSRSPTFQLCLPTAESPSKADYTATAKPLSFPQSQPHRPLPFRLIDPSLYIGFWGEKEIWSEGEGK